MKKHKTGVEIVFGKLGKILWDGNDAFKVITRLRVKLVLSPNTGQDSELPSQVIVDEIYVPPHLRRKGNATKAMKALCRLADKHKFVLLGGPIGFSNSALRDKYVEWVFGFGFRRDTAQHLRVDDPKAFYIRRRPRTASRRD